MHANLDDALALIFRLEGGFAERATEPGGSVNMGISRQTLASWRKVHGGPVPTVEDVRNLSKGEATAIYEAEYAAAVRFDDLPSGLDLAVLDSAVNEGVGWTRRALSEALGIAVVAILPPMPPLVAAASKADPITVINAICDERLAGKKQRAEWPKFGRGWTVRIEDVRSHAKQLAGATA